MIIVDDRHERRGWGEFYRVRQDLTVEQVTQVLPGVSGYDKTWYFTADDVPCVLWFTDKFSIDGYPSWRFSGPETIARALGFLI